jgi:uncharacterized membrane protein HdeD (DUF308 family)
MTRTGKQRLSRPLYEGLPWIYVAGGVVALAGSYFCPFRALSIAISLLGLLAVLGGVVVLLRRRDYRAMRSEYDQADATLRDLGGED